MAGPGEADGRGAAGAGPDDTHNVDDLDDLAVALADVGRAVRRAIGTTAAAGDGAVLRHEGGDEVFGVDDRAEAALFEGLRVVGRRWPGRLVVEGHDDPVPVGDPDGPWVFLVDPLDGTRPWLAGKRSAWVLLGAGRRAATLADLEVGAAVEVPTGRAAAATTAWARRGGPALAVDDDVTDRAGPGGPVTAPPPRRLRSRAGAGLDRAWVTVMRYAPGRKAAIGAWEDAVLEGFETYEDPYLCTGGLLMALAGGSDAAVLDPRPLLAPGTMASHPYDLAALMVARAAGVVVEGLPAGPLDVPVDVTTPVAWAGYADEELAAVLRPRVAAATAAAASAARPAPATGRRPATPAPGTAAPG